MPDRAQLADLDARITAAYSDLTIARARFAQYPSGEAVTACETALAKLDELLDRRFATTRGAQSLQAA
jgi:hypothetical protein